MIYLETNYFSVQCKVIENGKRRDQEIIENARKEKRENKTSKSHIRSDEH